MINKSYYISRILSVPIKNSYLFIFTDFDLNKEISYYVSRFRNEYKEIRHQENLYIIL